MSITGYYEQIYFKCNELILYYNFPVITHPDEEVRFDPCPHIEKLTCSRAHELGPDKCITERKCELYMAKDELFTDLGIHAPTLKELDQELRRKKV